MMEEQQPPASLPGEGVVSFAVASDPLEDPRVLQILSSAHWGLLSAIPDPSRGIAGRTIGPLAGRRSPS